MRIAGSLGHKTLTAPALIAPCSDSVAPRSCVHSLRAWLNQLLCVASPPNLPRILSQA